jgi:hypothetical protein
MTWIGTKNNCDESYATIHVSEIDYNAYNFLNKHVKDTLKSSS